MAKLIETTYTLKTFIRAFIGEKKDFPKLTKNIGGEPVIMWDGSHLLIYAKGKNQSHLLYDKIEFTRHRIGIFYFVVESRNYWDFKIKFSDDGFKKNTEYIIKKYI